MMRLNPCATCASADVLTFGRGGVQRHYCRNCGRSGQGYTGPTAWRLATDNWNRNNPFQDAAPVSDGEELATKAGSGRPSNLDRNPK